MPSSIVQSSVPAGRSQGFGEEIANSVSHGLACAVSIFALVLLVKTSATRSTTSLVAATVFGATMILLYLVSTLYHALPHGKAKRIFLILDHSAIYLFIAGSYTPFALGPLSGGWGWTIFGLIWGLAVLGVSFKALGLLNRPWLSNSFYLAMGWLVVIAVIPLTQRMAPQGLVLLVSGGLAYTAGILFFSLDSRWRYAHTIWHGFVVAGSGCHLFAALHYAQPYVG
ncbi:MAG: hemolysin III family protein [Alcaligenaceae bacterium]